MIKKCDRTMLKMMLKWLLPLICFASLTLVTGMDLAPMIRIAQCRSTCLQRLGTKGECGDKNDNCRQVIDDF